MPKDWGRFKRPFLASSQVEAKEKLETEISMIEEQIRVAELTVDRLQEQIKRITDEAMLEVPQQVLNDTKEELELLKGSLTKKQTALELNTVEANMRALQRLDDLELDSLQVPETGKLAVTKGQLTTLELEKRSAGTKTTLAEADVNDATLELHGLIATTFPELKLLLDKMVEAQEALADQQLLAKKTAVQLEFRTKRFDLANKHMVQLSERSDLMSSAEAIIESFRVESELLKSKQAAAKIVADDLETRKKALADAIEALEKALGLATEAPAPTTSPGKENHAKLVEAYRTLKEARADLELAQGEEVLATKKANDKALELKGLQDREKMLEQRAAVLELGAEVSALLMTVPELKKLVVWKESASKLQEEMGVSAYDAFADKGLRFMRGLDGLVALGMTDDEIVKIYQELKWPENWHPPRMRPQEANWLKVKGSLKDDKIAVEQERKSLMIQALGFAEQNQEVVLSNFGTGMQKVGLLDKSVATDVNQWATLLSSVITLGTAGARAVTAARQLNGSSVDPVEQMMLIDDVLTSVGATSGGLIKTAKNAITVSKAEQIAKLVPGLDTLANFGSMCANAIAATNYWVAAVADAAVHKKAQEQQHRLEASTDHVQSRGKQVAASTTVQTATDLIAFCGSICTLAGVTAPVGATLSLVSTAISSTEKGVRLVVETSLMQKAQNLLEKARAGDPEAREEIFRHHPYYATAIIALLAEEGDTVALAIYNNHKVTKDMIVRSSAKVLQKYLLRELQEEEPPMSWSEWGASFAKLGELISAGLTSFGKTLGALFDRVSGSLVRSPTEEQIAETNMAILQLGMTSVKQVQTAITNYNDAKKALATKEEEFKKLQSTDDGYKDAQTEVGKARLKVTELKLLVDRADQSVNTQLDRGLRAMTTLGTDHSESALARFQELVAVQRRCLLLLNQVD
ncbi:MAG: hypothetical protein H6740_21490 [Alphaproteobacteria bacterium]|nr:hypothetical protein [Alphaproteobacteria bacterium]